MCTDNVLCALGRDFSSADRIRSEARVSDTEDGGDDLHKIMYGGCARTVRDEN